MATQHTDVLILGGGLAGASAALALARAGRGVTLLEREREPRNKVCGEFLSTEAVTLLSSLGIHATPLGALPVHHVGLYSRHTSVTAPLPFPALSLTRKALDAHLLNAAGIAGARIARGCSAESLAHIDKLWHVTTANGDLLCAPHLILATGKHDLRGFPRPPGTQPGLVALKMYLQLAPEQATALQGRVELLLHPSGYTGLQLASDGSANLCALIERSHFARLGSRWQALLAELQATCAHAQTRLRDAQPLLDRPLAVSSIPYGFVRRHALADKLWAVGDQAAVIPSFTGDGMSIAIYTGLRAAEALLAGSTAGTFQSSLAADLQPQVRRATLISRALVWAPASRVLTAAAALYPPALTGVARLTRLPQPALQRLHATFAQ